MPLPPVEEAALSCADGSGEVSRSGAAGSMLDSHGRAEDGLEIPGKQSRRDVAAAACGIAHDHQDPAGGKLLREARTVSDDGQRRRTCGRAENATSAARIHGRLPAAGLKRRPLRNDQLKALPDQGTATSHCTACAIEGKTDIAIIGFDAIPDQSQDDPEAAK